MTMRVSGMVSGLDTDALVQELVSAYSTKKDNLVKAQTKHEWKMDAWKDMNSKIYSFYTKKLSNMRLSSAYSAKKATISKTSAATVSASTSVANGTQSLKITKLAKAGYLTGAKIAAEDGGRLTASTKLSDVKGMEDLTAGSKITVNGKDIDITSDMNIGQLVSKMKAAGVNASFDENNQRFYINAKSSGKDNDFSLTAATDSGINVLKALGVFTVNDADKAAYEKYANLSDDKIAALKAKTAAAQYYTDASYTEKLSKQNENYQKQIEDITKSAENITKQIEKLNEQRANDVNTEDDIKAIDEKIAKLNKDLDTANENIAKAQQLIEDNNEYLNDPDKLSAKVVELNADIDSKVSDDIDNKVSAARKALLESESTDTSGDGAVRIVGSDSEIWLNGARYTSNTNTYSINGLTIQAQELTGNDEVTINVDTDVDAVYNTIKDFFKGYNELIKEMDVKYNAASSGSYEPLTSEEKEAMTEDDIEKWETKIKDALLRRDSTLGNVSTAMKNVMLKSYDVNGTKMSLSSFGIKTLGYFSAADNERGVYHIDGDSDDENTSGSADKLKEAIANDPESVISFFQQLSTDLYDTLTDKMKGSTLSSAYTVYNDKQMKTEYDSYKSKISDMEDYLQDKEDYWYKKFSAMETALSKLQSSTSSLTSLFGNG